MSARRLPHLILAALMAMLAALPVFVSAAPPEFETVELDFFEPDPFLTEACGFAVLSGVEGTIKVSTRETRGDTIIEIARYRLVTTYANAKTGETLRTPNVGIDKFTTLPDGSATLAVMGLAEHVIVPGEGRIAASAGRVVLFFEGPDDQEPDVLFESAGLDVHILRSICSVLAP